MKTLLLCLLLLYCFAMARADGVFIPKIDPDPRTHAADISEPDQKALIAHNNGVELMVLQVSYRGNASEFAWLVPTPSVPKVSQAYARTFHELHEVTAPRLKYWFDADRKLHSGARGGAKGMAASSVEVIQEKTIGVYDIAVLKASRAEDLIVWLRKHDYQVNPKIAPVVSDYLRRGWVFTGMRINTAKQASSTKGLNVGALQSLEFRFVSRQPVYPLRISSLNAGRTKIIIYTVAYHRMQAAGFETLCALENIGGKAYYARTPYYYGSQLGISPGQLVLTKLTATLSSDSMKSDVLLARSAANTELPVQPVYAPFLDNIGVIALLSVSRHTLVVWPVMFIILIALAFIPRTRHLEMPRLAIYLAALLFLWPFAFAIGTSVGPDLYRAAGITCVVLLAAAVAVTFFSTRRRYHPK